MYLTFDRQYLSSLDYNNKYFMCINQSTGIWNFDIFFIYLHLSLFLQEGNIINVKNVVKSLRGRVILNVMI